jgi:hypothetical protein
MLLMPDEVEKKKQEAALIDTRSPEEAVTSLLAPVIPKTPWEKMQEEHGTGGSIMRILGTGLSGGILADALMPEMTKAGQDRYDAELAAYGDQVEAFNMANALSGIDPENITPATIALADAYGGSALSEYYTDQYAAQQAQVGTDHAVAEMAGVPYAQWIQRSPEQKRADRNYYQSQNGDGTYFDAQLQAEGKAPGQLQAAKQSESFGTATGTQYGEDRAVIRGVRGQVMKSDQTLESLDNVMALLQNGENDDLTGIERQIRDLFWSNRKDDGTVDAVVAQGVVDLISQATFGALSQSELDLLKGGMMDPSKSVEYNIGTLTEARKRVENDRSRYIDAAKSAADRYSKWDGQDDYDILMEDDWLYNNIGEGSRFKSIPKPDGSGELTFSEFSEKYVSGFKRANPYATEMPTRAQLIVEFNKKREQYKKQWEAEQERLRLEAEELEQAKASLIGSDDML